MVNLLRTTSTHTDFIELVKLLDNELAVRDGEMHNFYNQYNAIDNLNHVVIAYQNNNAVGCGAFKPYDDNSVEIKRMFVPFNKRGKGTATQILKALELWAREIGFDYAILETGKRQPEAIALYTRYGYSITDNYGPYIGVENSVCFKKEL